MSLVWACAACIKVASSRSGRKPYALRAALTAWSRPRLVEARWAAKAAGTAANSTKTAANTAKMVLIPRSTAGESRKPFGWCASPFWGIRGARVVQRAAGLGARGQRLGQLRPRGDLQL